MEGVWRLLFSPPAGGPDNMAIDEAILAAVAEGRSPPTLRFYAWDPPCLSLGYAQPVSDVDQARLSARGWDCVRRPTGGRAILHTDELTYSVVAALEHPLMAGSVVESYRRLSQGLMRGLEGLGMRVEAKRKSQATRDRRNLAGGAGFDRFSPRPEPVEGRVGGSSPGYDAAGSETFHDAQNRAPENPICFEAPSDYEVTVGGRKLLGSAQVRRRGVVLQHGSLPLAGDLARIVDALRLEDEASRPGLRARVHERALTLAEALGREVAWDQAAEAMRAGFVQALGLALAPGQLLAQEIDWAQKFKEEKYAAAAWLGRV